MNGWEMWIQPVSAVFFAIFLPYVVQLVKRANWSSVVNWVIAVVISILAGVFTAFINGTPTPETLVAWVTAVVGGVQAAYNLFKAIGVTNDWLDKWFYFTSEDDTGTVTESVAATDNKKAEYDNAAAETAANDSVENASENGVEVHKAK